MKVAFKELHTIMVVVDTDAEQEIDKLKTKLKILKLLKVN